MKFYGTNLQHSPRGTNVMIVLELCICSLRDHAMSHPENSPARLPNDAVKKKVLTWAQNILEALHYIHSEGFVHRDLKLENLLVNMYPISRTLDRFLELSNSSNQNLFPFSNQTLLF